MTVSARQVAARKAAARKAVARRENTGDSISTPSVPDVNANASGPPTWKRTPTKGVRKTFGACGQGDKCGVRNDED